MWSALLVSSFFAAGDGGWLPPKKDAPDPTAIRSSLTTHVELSGPLGQEYTEKLLDGRLPQWRRCFERQLAKGAKTYGRYVFTVGVAPSGRPAAVVVTTDTLKMPRTLACVKAVVAGLKWPKATMEGKLELTLTFASLE